MQIIRDLLDKKGDSPQEIVLSRGLGKAEDDAVQKAVREAIGGKRCSDCRLSGGKRKGLELHCGPGNEEDPRQGKSR